MEIQNPHVLWLLALVPPLAWWWHRRRKAAVRFSDTSLFARLPRERAAWADAVSLTLRLTALVLLIAAIARPRWPDETSRIPAEGIAISVVLDISGSMGEEDFELGGTRMTRLDAAKAVFERFLTGSPGEFPGRKEDMVGLVTFAMLPDDIHPPTLSHAALVRTLPDIHATKPPDATTNIGDAMAIALRRLLNSRPKTKVMILISDGEHTVPSNELVDPRNPDDRPWNPERATAFARSLGVRVHTIYTGPDPKFITDKQTSENAEAGLNTMKFIAAQTGGTAYRAESAAALLEVWQAIDRSERTQIESFRYFRYTELYPWLGWAVLAITVFVFVVESRRV